MEPLRTQHESATAAADAGWRTLIGSAAISAALCLVKGVAYGYTGSLLLLGSLLDSLGDTGVSLVNAWAHRHARLKADRAHPFGHGGIEVLTSFVQGLMLLSLAALLAWRSITGLAGLGTPLPLDFAQLPWAAAVLAGSAVVSLLLQLSLAKAHRSIRATNSRALAVEADHAHYAGDALNNALSAIGIGLVYATNNQRLDAALALISAVNIARLGWPILARSGSDIVHREAGADVQRDVRELAIGVDQRILGLHRLRTRSNGPTLFIDFHLVLPADLPLAQAHAIGEKVMLALQKNFPGADVIMHLDPDNEPPDDFF